MVGERKTASPLGRVGVALNFVFTMGAVTMLFGCEMTSGPTIEEHNNLSDPTPVTNQSNSVGAGCEPWPTCSRPPNDSESDYLNNYIDALSGTCEDMSLFFGLLHSDGRIRVYDGWDGAYGDIHFEGTDSVAIDLYAGTFASFSVGSTLRHEYGHERETGAADTEERADEYMFSCQPD